jgi:hypothetical protein
MGVRHEKRGNLMKKAVIALLALFALLALAGAPAFAEGLGLDFGLETATSDLLNEDEDFGLQLKPFVDYTWGDTGWVFELNWQFPVLPDAKAGHLESWQEYDFSAFGLDFAVGNDNWYFLDTEGFADENDALEGSLYGIAIVGLPIEGLALWGEVDVYYAYEDTDNDFIVDGIFTPTYTRQIGPGTLVAKLRNYFHFYQKDTDAEYSYIELRLSYEMPTGPVMAKLEVRPRIQPVTESQELQLVGMVTVTYSM